MDPVPGHRADPARAAWPRPENRDREQHRARPATVLRGQGLADLIDAYALSYEIGVQKPGRGIFDAASRMLGTSPAETLMVGDDPVSDGGAGAAGLGLYILPPHTGAGAARGLDRVIELVDRSRQ